MLLVIGEYGGFDYNIKHIFGYVDNEAEAESFIENLKLEVCAFKDEHAKIRRMPYNAIPPQEKFEKLKAYQTRIQPLQAENEAKENALKMLNRSVSDHLKPFTDFYGLSDFEFSTQEVNRL